MIFVIRIYLTLANSFNQSGPASQYIMECRFLSRVEGKKFFFVRSISRFSQITD